MHDSIENAQEHFAGIWPRSAAAVPGSSGNDLFGEMKVNKQLATSTTAVLYSCTVPCRVHSTSAIWHREDIERSHSIKRAVACFPD